MKTPEIYHFEKADDDLDDDYINDDEADSS